LENDNRGVNVKRGQRSRVEMGLWPGMAPLGYLNQNQQDKKCQLVIDKERAPVIKQMYEKVAHEKWSGMKIYNWLKFELNFRTRGDKHLALSGVYRALTSPFYYGMFEYPKKSGNWYKGKHVPIITQDIFNITQEQLQRDQVVRQNKEFAFTKLFTCGKCGSGITAEEKYKHLKDGTTAKYIYYGCSRGRDRNCKNKYIREEELIQELLRILDQINLNELGMKNKLEDEIKRFNKFQHVVIGSKANDFSAEVDVNVRKYAKYLLKQGSTTEKRELLANLRSRLTYQDKKLTLLREEQPQSAS
ncbi:MAG: recombinase family protein, partial [Parcubacteria group bacterium]